MRLKTYTMRKQNDYLLRQRGLLKQRTLKTGIWCKEARIQSAVRYSIDGPPPRSTFPLIAIAVHPIRKLTYLNHSLQRSCNHHPNLRINGTLNSLSDGATTQCNTLQGSKIAQQNLFVT